MYLDFVPQELTLFDMSTKNKRISLAYHWDLETYPDGSRYDTGTYYAGPYLSDNEWRVTIDGQHYRIPYNTPVNGINDAGVTVDVHKTNPVDVPAHWTGSDEYVLTNNGTESNGFIYYTYKKQTPGK